MTARTRHLDLPSYVTKDGSAIRDQSLAEAIVQPGEKTRLHRHRVTEELGQNPSPKKVHQRNRSGVPGVCY